MSQPSRPRDRGQSPRRRPQFKIHAIESLEQRAVLAPFVSTTVTGVTFTAGTAPNPNVSTGTVAATATAMTDSAAPVTSISKLADLSQFGGDMVRIEAGQGGDFGKALYAISRGGGSNPAAVNNPGVIYRVDPVTGKASVWFDLNPVIKQMANNPAATAANSLGTGTGYVNWYDMAFDPEGYFDGRPSMFVTSSDATDPNKNAVYRIGSNGDFLGVYVGYSANVAGSLTRSPTAISVTPAEQAKYLRGLFTGNSQAGLGSATDQRVLFIDSNAFRPGTDLNSTTTLPAGAIATNANYGQQSGITSVDATYEIPANAVYDTFTNFGIPGAPAPNPTNQPGQSGVQGIAGNFLIGRGVQPAAGSAAIDTYPGDVFTSNNAPLLNGYQGLAAFRRFQDISFDRYQYFSYGFPSTVTGSTVTFAAAQISAPVYAGSVFVADLSNGLAVSVPPPAAAPAGTPNFVVPVGPNLTGTITITLNAQGAYEVTTNSTFPAAPQLDDSGRIIRIDTNGVVTNFAEGFKVWSSTDSSAFQNSSLSITFSADGTTLYASDADGIWQFKTVTSLAGSTSGNLIGLNDLRTFGVPYQGEDSAVAVLDTGIDAQTPNFRGRVAKGANTLFNSVGGNDDLAPGGATAIGQPDGHGTLIAGVIAQFVPQATLVPVNVFPVGQTNTNNTAVYNGLTYLSQNPFVNDPIRPGQQDRVVATAIGFGSSQIYQVEGVAYRQQKQLTLAFKDRLQRLRAIGNQPIAATGNNNVSNGSVNGMAVPAVYNEVVSASGVYPFPFVQDATTPPTDPSPGVIPRPSGPILLFPTQGSATLIGAGNLQTFTAGDNGTYYADRVIANANRSITTDFMAPAIDVPTFRRTNAGTNGAPIPGTNTFYASGTSLSAGIVAGSFATVASALDYWTQMARTGVTSDAYLNVPVGTRTLNFGAHKLLDLSVYANPDGINSILQWTAVPVEDPTRTIWNPKDPIRGGYRSPEYARIDIGNAIAAIEATQALNYLIDKNQLQLLDSNNNGLITAQSIQSFVNRANTIGLPEAGAMARLLGGTDRIDPNNATPTFFGERPDSPDVLQRRFNFLDFAAHGKLTGSISIQELTMLAHTLLPPPDSFVVTDRQRASVNGFLLEPTPTRNYIDLRHLLPTYVWVPRTILRRWRGVPPGAFGINFGQPKTATGPYQYDLFSNVPKASNQPSTGTAGAGKAARAAAAAAAKEAQLARQAANKQAALEAKAAKAAAAKAAAEARAAANAKTPTVANGSPVKPTTPNPSPTPTTTARPTTPTPSGGTLATPSTNNAEDPRVTAANALIKSMTAVIQSNTPGTPQTAGSTTNTTPSATSTNPADLLVATGETATDTDAAKDKDKADDKTT